MIEDRDLDWCVGEVKGISARLGRVVESNFSMPAPDFSAYEVGSIIARAVSDLYDLEKALEALVPK